MKIRVAGAQMAVQTDILINTKKILVAIDRAAEAGTDILLTPEGSLSGYRPDFDVPDVEMALHRVTAYACERHIGLALGTCFVELDEKCYNQIRFYRPDGAYLGFHSKILRCGSLKSPTQGEINHYAATPLQTFSWQTDFILGGLICNDLWANPGCTPMPDPHLSQQLSDMNARIIFHAVNGGRSGNEWSNVAWQYHESNLRMRARAGALWIVVTDNAAPADMPCSTPSGVISPEGEWVCRTKANGEVFFMYTISLQQA